LNVGTDLTPFVGRIVDVEAESTATGPISDAAIAATGSDALWHAQE
jgi:hypothetical protein